MSFLKRLFSADYRAAVAAEAAGDLELAAERYALAGQPDAAVRVHLARAQRADDRGAAIKALRDALHWAGPGSPHRPEVARSLGRALLARALDEGVATERDRERVREAARLLIDGGDHERAGDALERIGDDRAAATAFERGGLVHRMEVALARQSHERDRERALRDAFAEYEMRMRGGERDAARDALRACVTAAERKGEYRRLLDELESRLITGGRVELRRRSGADTPGVVLCGGAEITLGRDALSDLPLRAGGVSRAHAAIEVRRDGAARSYLVRDAGSRNGTLLGGMPIAGAVPLLGDGAIALGEECTVAFATAGEPALLTLRIEGGLDRGTALRAGAEGDVLGLRDLLGLTATLRFERGRPLLDTDPPEATLSLNGDTVARGEVQLIHGDTIVIEGVEVDVA